MRVKVDEDLPRAAVDLLVSRGYDAVGVVDQGMGGWTDETLWGVVQKEERYFVTADKGFGDIRTHVPGTHMGILLLRPDDDGIRPLVGLLTRVLDQHKLDDLASSITVATPRTVRVRRS